MPGSWLTLGQEGYCWKVKWMLFSGGLRLALGWDFLFWLCGFPNPFGASSDCAFLGEQRRAKSFGAGRGNAGGLNHSTSLGMEGTAQSGGTGENRRAEGFSCLETQSFYSERERELRRERAQKQKMTWMLSRVMPEPRHSCAPSALIYLQLFIPFVVLCPPISLSVRGCTPLGGCWVTFLCNLAPNEGSPDLHLCPSEFTLKGNSVPFRSLIFFFFFFCFSPSCAAHSEQQTPQP